MALTLADSGDVRQLRPMTRLIVLPFRVLRADPDIDFLSFSLADAITTSLSGLESLVVRSSHAGARFAAGPPDLKAIAAETNVDIVLVGTLLRAADQLRVTTQLLEAPDGTVIWSHTAQVSFGDIFQLQDDWPAASSAPCHSADRARTPGVEARRAGQREGVPVLPAGEPCSVRGTGWLGGDSGHLDRRTRFVLAVRRRGPAGCAGVGASGPHLPCPRQIRPRRRGRKLEARRIGLQARAEIYPDLSIAHNLYAYLEVDLGRARDAMLRLVDRAGQRSGDPELFAGLVHACRYAACSTPRQRPTNRPFASIRRSRRAWRIRFSCSVTMRGLHDKRRGQSGTIAHPRDGDARAGRGSACDPRPWACRGRAAGRLSRGRPRAV